MRYSAFREIGFTDDATTNQFFNLFDSGTQLIDLIFVQRGHLLRHILTYRSVKSMLRYISFLCIKNSSDDKRNERFFNILNDYIV